MNKTRMLVLITFIQHNSGSLSHKREARKRKKRNPNWKKRGKLLLFANTTIYRKP